jgi:hypothetical protein
MTKIPYHLEIIQSADKFAMYHGYDANGREYYAIYGLEHSIGIYKGTTPYGAIYFEAGTYIKVSLRMCYPTPDHPYCVCQDASYVIKADESGKSTHVWIPRVVAFVGDPLFEDLKSQWDFFHKYLKDIVADTDITVYDWWGNVVQQITRESLYATSPPLYDNYPYEQLPTPPDPPPMEDFPSPPPPQYNTRITLFAPQSVIVGTQFTVTALLEYYDGSAWKPLPDQTINFCLDNNYYVSGKTGSDGKVSISAVFNTTGTHTIRASYDGALVNNIYHKPSSSTITIEITAQQVTPAPAPTRKPSLAWLIIPITLLIDYYRRRRTK